MGVSYSTTSINQSINQLCRPIVGTTDHDCYDHYELKTYPKLFNCDGCKTKGYGQRYHCTPCGRELHRECRFPTTTPFSHDFFPGSTFKFCHVPLTRPNKNGDDGRRREFSKCCSACRKDICGFSYRCDATDKDLHPCCRNLDTKLLVDDTVFDLRARVRSKCIWCKKRKITGAERDVRGWTYVSACKKYNFHVFCMVEIMHEACMKSGEAGLDSVELRELVRKRGGNRGNNKIFWMIKLVLKIISTAFLGDPTALIADVFVEWVARALK